MTAERAARGGIELDGGRRAFAPGEEMAGRVRWWMGKDPRRVELRLRWRTEGKGEPDTNVVQRLGFEDPRNQEHRPFRLRLPDSPYSFSGKLISLVWSLELKARPGGMLDVLEITLSPTGAEVRLAAPTGGFPGSG